MTQALDSNMVASHQEHEVINSVKKKKKGLWIAKLTIDRDIMAFIGVD